VPFYYCTAVVVAFSEVRPVCVYGAFFYKRVFAIFLAAAGWLRSTCLARISSSVSSSSSCIVSSVGVGGVVVCCSSAPVVGCGWPLSPAVQLTFSCFTVVTQLDAPSRSSRFLILRRTPST
jgi:phosphate/sulfate permease